LLVDAASACGADDQSVQLGVRAIQEHTIDLLADLGHGKSSLAGALREFGKENGLEKALGARAALFDQSVRQTSAMLGDRNRPRIVMLDSYGWDTHCEQGAHDGRLAHALETLSYAVEDLAAACRDFWRDAVVLILTEFGRSVVPNYMGGTDHGAATVIFLLGGNVAGGQVIGRWPGLSPKCLYSGRDLAPTSDIRAVVKSVLLEHMGLPRFAVEHAIADSPSIEPISGLFRS
jgi:uncharacterized protein (DUF1501 family)